MVKQHQKKLKYGQLVDLILEAIASNLIEMGKRAYIKPSLSLLTGYIIKYILETKKKKIKEEKIKTALKGLERRQVLYIEKKHDQACVYLKEKGKEKVIKYSLKLLLDFKMKEKKWDGKWFLVFFDVPENQRVKRDSLRAFLKQLGFYQYQKSVYLFPYECEQEVALIKKVVEGARYMKYIIAEKIEDGDFAKGFFKLG